MEYKNAHFANNQPQESEVSLVEILIRYLRYWKWIMLSVLAALVMAFIYLRYTVPMYEVTSSVMLKDVKNQVGSKVGVGGLGSLDGLELMGGISSLENETFVIRSEISVREVIDRLNLHTSYIVGGRIKSMDLYTNSPFIVSMEGVGLDTLQQDIVFTATLNKDKSISLLGTIGDKE